MSGEQLERRYRKLLQVLPKPYREVRGEELLSTLMDGAAEGRTRPELREGLSLVRLGLRARLLATADGGEVSTRAGEMVRAVGIAGTMLLALFGVTELATNVAITRWDPSTSWNWSHPFTLNYFGQRESILSYEVPAGWLVVLGLLTVGWWRAARVPAVLLFLESAYLTGGFRTFLHEETVLAGVVTAALFAVRGVHARRVLVPGLAATAFVLGIAGWLYEGRIGPPLNSVMALLGWGFVEDQHAWAVAALAAAVGCAVGLRSAAWAVALAVVVVAALAPIAAWVSFHSDLEGLDVAPSGFLAGTLVAVAGLAVAKEWRALRGARSTPAS